MAYTLAEAAKACGRGKSTIHKAIQTGQLSAQKGANGAYEIDGAELARVFPPRPQTVHGPSPWEVSGREETTRDGGDTALRVEVERLKEQLAREQELHDRTREDAREEREDLRRRLDRAEERVLALSAEPAPEPPPMVEELRRRLEETEAHLRALVTLAPPAPQAAQERPSESSVGITPTGARRGFLARLLGR